MTKPMYSHTRRWSLPTALAMAILCSTAATVAWAGEIKIGASALEVDDKGNLSAAGRKNIVDTLDEVPGEDVWKAYVWTKLDNAAAGPLYFEFYQNLNGENSMVWRYDAGEIPGGKYWSGEIELEGGKGFNKDRTYDMKAVQVSAKGKDLTLATGKIKLIKSGKKPEKAADDEGDDDKVPEDQDAHDSLAGGDDDKGDADAGNSGEAPPPVEPKAKKGCSIDTDGGAWNGALLLVVAGLGLATRRRRG